MRIGFDTLVENPRRPSSAVNYLKTVLRALGEIAPEHEIFAFVSPENRKWFTKVPQNVQLVECPASNENIPLRVLTQQLWYPVLARRFGLDVIHAINQVPLLSTCATVVKTCGLHHHLTPEQFRQNIPGLDRWMHLGRLFYRRIMWDRSAQRASAVIANSEYTKREIQRFMNVPEERIHVVPEAVGEEFQPAADPAAVRKHIATRLGVHRPYVLYVSNLWFYKNPDGAIRAFCRARNAHRLDADLVVAGHDDYQRLTTLESIAVAERCGNRVHFLGRVTRDELVALYQAARVAFYPSFAETFGKPVVEAMRCGIPLVAARATSIPELMADGGLLVDPSDIDEMAEALWRAATDEALRARLTAAGRRRAADFSWARTALGTLETCALVATNGRH